MFHALISWNLRCQLKPALLLPASALAAGTAAVKPLKCWWYWQRLSAERAGHIIDISCVRGAHVWVTRLFTMQLERCRWDLDLQNQIAGKKPLSALLRTSLRAFCPSSGHHHHPQEPIESTCWPQRHRNHSFSCAYRTPSLSPLSASGFILLELYYYYYYFHNVTKKAQHWEQSVCGSSAGSSKAVDVSALPLFWGCDIRAVKWIWWMVGFGS